MFNNISTLGWVVIIGLAVFILALNLGLFLGVRQKMEKDNWIDKMTEVGQILQHPLKKEDDRYQQLSEQVAKIKPIIKNKENDHQ